MKFLITGGQGFIGSNFIEKLFEMYPDSSVQNIDAELFGSNRKNLKHLEKSKNYNFVKGNITNFKLMKKLIENSDVIVNFAAESFVDRSISNSKPFLDSNIIGVHNILEILKKEKKKMIHISTDEVFGSLKSGSANEQYRFNPSSPYSSTKAAAELLIVSYNKTYDLDCSITRCTNNYGPKQFPEKLIPKVILLAQRNQRIPVYGSGKNIRDWIYVDDHCNAILKVMKHGTKGESYNISTNNEMDNISIIKKILKIMDKSEELIEFVEDRPGHDWRYSLDSKKIRNELDWKENVNFEKGIEKTVKWYLDNSDWWDNLNKILSKKPWKT